MSINKLKNKKSEKGSSLIIALIFMVALFLVVTSAMKFQRSTAENISQVSLASQDKWAARTLTARAGAWIITKLPEFYKNDLAAAVASCNNKNLPAFNSLSNPDAAVCEESYLGNIETWLSSKESAAVAFAIENNPTAKVTVKIIESYRSGSGGATSYHINYSAESGNGETYGADQNQNEFVLGSSENCICELRLSASSNLVAAGSPVTFTAEFWNIEKIELYENNVLIESQLIENLKTKSVKSWSRVVNQDSEYYVRGMVSASNCSGTSNVAVVAISSVPTPTPTPTITPTPTPTITPTPPVFASRLCLAMNGGNGQAWIATVCAEKNAGLLNINANIGGPTNYFSPACYVAVKDQFGNNLANVSCNANGGSAANHPNIVIPVSSEVDHLEFGFSARNQGNGSIGGVGETLGIGGCRMISGNGTCSRY